MATWYDHALNVGSAVLRFVPPGVFRVELMAMGIQVDIGFKKSVRVNHFSKKQVVAVSGGGNFAAFIHPSGVVYKKGNDVEMLIHASKRRIIQARASNNGVTFTKDSKAWTYKIDEAGVKTTKCFFSDLTGDFSIPVFLTNAGRGTWETNYYLMQAAEYWTTNNGEENWKINGVRVFLTPEGSVGVQILDTNHEIKLSKSDRLTLETPYYTIIGNVNDAGIPFLFVKQGVSSLTWNNREFKAQYKMQRAGYNDAGKFQL